MARAVKVIPRLIRLRLRLQRALINLHTRYPDYDQCRVVQRIVRRAWYDWTDRTYNHPPA